MDSLKEKAKKRKTTSNPENWRKAIAVSLHADDMAMVERLCKRHDMNRSELFRYLLLKESKRSHP